MTFTYPTLALVGAALAAVPIVIHLLNLRRRRRVQWAAMDFLLQSDKKNRTWVRLSEWLLLAMRVLAIGLAGLLAATPKTSGLLDGFFGTERALHLVLLDDTVSMQRREAGTTGWQEATAAIDRLVETAKRSGDQVIVTRYTDVLAGRGGPSEVDGPAGLSTWQPTNAATTARDGLEQLLKQREASTNASKTYAYVFSDFAETSHSELADWADPLRDLGREATEVVLASCGEAAAANLSISELKLAPGPVAAGVETRLLIEVTNHSDEAAPTVSVAIRRDGQPLSAVDIGPFEPGSRRRVEAPITLAGVGLHVVDAALPGDRLPVDDQRWLAIETLATQTVLLVDNSERAIESRVFAAALRPIGKARSGWAPTRVAKPTADDLDSAAAVMVVDIDRLAPASLTALREYVEAGGGVLWLAGPQTDADWFNRRVAGGLAGQGGLVPWRLGPPTSVTPVAAGEPMLRVADHFALRVLGGERNGFLPLVRAFVRRRLATDAEAPTVQNASAAGSESDYNTLAAFDDGQPLMVESRYGEGRVLGLLTTSATGRDDAPPWSNLATLPIFPVLVNDLAGWLAHDRLAPRIEAIGDEPSGGSAGTLLRWTEGGDFEADAGLAPDNPLLLAEPGVYRRVVGRLKSAPVAAVIDPSESDLRGVPLTTLRNRWGDHARVGRAEEMFRETPTPASRTPLYAVAATLLAICVIERVLAYRNSYLQPGSGTSLRGGMA